jgi:hypothetical protein
MSDAVPMHRGTVGDGHEYAPVACWMVRFGEKGEHQAHAGDNDNKGTRPWKLIHRQDTR